MAKEDNSWNILGEEPPQPPVQRRPAGQKQSTDIWNLMNEQTPEKKEQTPEKKDQTNVDEPEIDLMGQGQQGDKPKPIILFGQAPPTPPDLWDLLEEEPVPQEPYWRAAGKQMPEDENTLNKPMKRNKQGKKKGKLKGKLKGKQAGIKKQEGHTKEAKQAGQPQPLEHAKQGRAPQQQASQKLTQKMNHREARKANRTDADFEDEKPPKRRRHILRWASGSVAVLCALLFIALAVMLLRTTRNDDLWLDLAQVPYRHATLLYATDRQGQTQEFARLSSTQNQEYVSSGDIPQLLKDAFVAVEDKDFYNHHGVSLRRTLYAVLNELKKSITGSYIGGDGGRKQGASTIDQQLIKNLTLDDENSNLAGYLRKIREIFRAYKLDNNYEKDEILTAYLNIISFTGNTAGVQAEAKKLFGKPVGELSLAECASIASITRNPTRYNPIKNPDDHLVRRNYVLQLMLEQGMIHQDQYNAAAAEPLELEYAGEPDMTHPVTSYFTDVVMEEAMQQLTTQRGITRAEASHLLYNGGLRIYTTVVPQLQQAMESMMGPNNGYPKPGVTVQKPQYSEDGSPRLDETGFQIIAPETVYPQAAMISLDYNGGICAVVGGLGDKEVSRGFNRATRAVRQVGSTMKPIGPYAVALERDKITWSTPFLDAPVRLVKDEATGQEKEWPVNATNYYSQKNILVKDAFAKSINTVAVRVGDLAGIGNMYSFVHGKLEITSLTSNDKDSGPLVLGSSTYGITPLEMARAYTIFGNGGQLPTAHSFTSIQAGTGVVWLAVATKQKSVLGEDTAYITNRLMGEVMKGGGTASGMAVADGIESIGKTGTTSDHRDHWFIGLTPYYVTASWYGYDENLPLGADSHWNPPIVAWRTVMQKGQAGLADASFAGTASVITAEYCTVSGSRAGVSCPSAIGYYKIHVLPPALCPVHG